MLRKLIALALKPLGAGLILVGGGLLLARWRRTWGRRLAVTGMVLLWMLSTPWMGTMLLGSLEYRYPPQPVEAVSHAEAIVVLGGGISPAGAYRIDPDMNDSADRIWHGGRLYRAGVAPTIIVSGGTPPGRRTGPSAPAMRSLLVQLGVPTESIVAEKESGSTYGNALHTAELCARRGITRIVLVTSAWHMPRAEAAFRSAGLDVIPAPTDYVAPPEPFSVYALLPTVEDGLRRSTQAVHEYLGYAYYSLRGWI